MHWSVASEGSYQQQEIALTSLIDCLCMRKETAHPPTVKTQSLLMMELIFEEQRHWKSNFYLYFYKLRSWLNWICIPTDMRVQSQLAKNFSKHHILFSRKIKLEPGQHQGVQPSRNPNPIKRKRPVVPKKPPNTGQLVC